MHFNGMFTHMDPHWQTLDWIHFYLLLSVYVCVSLLSLSIHFWQLWAKQTPTNTLF